MPTRCYLAAAFLALFGMTIPAYSERPAHDLVTVAAPWGTFRIDRHEVTVGQFRAFVAATGLRTKAETEGGGRQYLGGWQKMLGWVWSAPYGKPARDDEPVVHVTFPEAVAYCKWAGLRLPTDREWVEAAYTERRQDPPAGFTNGRSYAYPTGDSPEGANQTSARTLTGFMAPRSELGQGRGHLPVKSTKTGANGLYDMGANVWEWVDQDTGGQKRTRGGSWWYGPAQMRADAIYDKPADFPAVYIGFRCAG